MKSKPVAHHFAVENSHRRGAWIYFWLCSTRHWNYNKSWGVKVAAAGLSFKTRFALFFSKAIKSFFLEIHRRPKKKKNFAHKISNGASHQSQRDNNCPKPQYKSFQSVCGISIAGGIQSCTFMHGTRRSDDEQFMWNNKKIKYANNVAASSSSLFCCYCWEATILVLGLKPSMSRCEIFQLLPISYGSVVCAKLRSFLAVSFFARRCLARSWAVYDAQGKSANSCWSLPLAKLSH